MESCHVFSVGRASAGKQQEFSLRHWWALWPSSVKGCEQTQNSVPLRWCRSGWAPVGDGCQSTAATPGQLFSQTSIFSSLSFITTLGVRTRDVLTRGLFGVLLGTTKSEFRRALIMRKNVIKSAWCWSASCSTLGGEIQKEDFPAGQQHQEGLRVQRRQKAEGKDNIRFPFLAAVPPAVKAAVHYPVAHHLLPPQVSAFPYLFILGLTWACWSGDEESPVIWIIASNLDCSPRLCWEQSPGSYTADLGGGEPAAEGWW